MIPTPQPLEKIHSCTKCHKQEKRFFHRAAPTNSGRFRYEWKNEAGRLLWFDCCYECYKAQRRRGWQGSKKQTYAQKYRKTKFGFVMNAYSNLTRRCVKGNKRTDHIYKGLPIPTKEEFYEWALKSEKFDFLFEEYQKRGRKRWHAPSIDRIDSSKGYTLDNMQWIPLSENVLKAHRERGHTIRHQTA